MGFPIAQGIRVISPLGLTRPSTHVGVKPSKTNLVFWYEFDSGLLVDSHTNNLTLTNNGSGGGASLTTGKIGQGVNFVGASSQYLSRVTSAIIETGDVDFQIGGMYYAQNSGAYTMVKANTSGAREWSALHFLNNGLFQFTIGIGASSTFAINHPAIGVNQWHFWSFWYKSSNRTLYGRINGGSTISGQASQQKSVATNAPLNIGGRANQSVFSNNIQDSIFMFKQNLTDDEYDYIHNNGAGIVYADLA